MNVLVGCEFSGIVREAFRIHGHDAWSCDLLDSEIPGQHIKGDLFDAIKSRVWDLLIFHWPCTNMAVSGARWFPEKRKEQAYDVACFEEIMERAPIARIAGENPISVLSSQYRKPDQIIQPWWFGTGETKATCIWKKNLPDLLPTNPAAGRVARVHLASPGPNRWKERSRTDFNIADAMAVQWGRLGPFSPSLEIRDRFSGLQ